MLIPGRLDHPTAGTRLRGGSAASARGAASMITEGIGTARAAGCTGTLVLDADPYPSAVWDNQLGCWMSDAQVAETQYTAFTSKKGQAVTAG